MDQMRRGLENHGSSAEDKTECDHDSVARTDCSTSLDFELLACADCRRCVRVRWKETGREQAPRIKFEFSLVKSLVCLHRISREIEWEKIIQSI